MTGAVLFVVLVGVAFGAVVAVVRGLLQPRPVAQYTSPVVGDRPCAVYEIFTTRGKYIGHGYDPGGRIAASHRKAEWWPRAVNAGRTGRPDRVDWYRSKAAAHAEEVRRIRSTPANKLENKILYRGAA